MNYNERMTATLLADQARWQARQDAENTFEASRAGMESYEGERPILRGIGLISPPRKKTNDLRRDPRTKVVGVATVPGHIPTAAQIAQLASGNVNPSMTVTRDGITTIVEVTHSRTSRRRTAPIAQSATMPETARHTPKLRHDFNA